MCIRMTENIDEDKASQLGIDGYAVKPITRRKIATSIRKILDRI